MKNIRLRFIKALLLGFIACSTNAYSATQTITTGNDAFEVMPGDIINVPLIYSSDKPKTTGLGLSLCFDSKKLKFLGFDETIKKDLIAKDTQSGPDVDNRDQNENTDACAAIAWLSVGGEWPDSEQLPTTLVKAQFEVLDTKDSTTEINITGQPAAKTTFSAKPVRVEIGLSETQADSGSSAGGGSVSWLMPGLLMVVLRRRVLQGFKVVG